LEIIKRDFDENTVENFDFYHALYYEDDALHYITETNRYMVDEKILILDNEDYNPNFFFHEMYEDWYENSYEAMYKLSVDLRLYNIIVLISGQVKYENSSMAGELNSFDQYNARSQLTEDRNRINDYSNNEMNELTMNNQFYTLTKNNYLNTIEAEFILDSDNEFYIDTDSYFSQIIKNNNRYYLIAAGSNEDEFIAKVYTLELGAPTLNYNLTNYIKSGSYWMAVSLLFLPIFCNTKRDYI